MIVTKSQSLALVMVILLSMGVMLFQISDLNDIWYPRESTLRKASETHAEAQLTAAQFRAEKAELEAKAARLEAAEQKAARQKAEAEAEKYKANAERPSSPAQEVIEPLPEALRPVEAKTKFLLTICTMVKNDAPYIVEWIEFLRLQGVDRFIIYNDGSSDGLPLLNQFYAQRDPNAHVYVVNGPNVSLWERLNNVIKDCFRDYSNSTEWMMIADSDEFIHAPYYGTIRNLIENLPEHEKRAQHPISALTAPCSTFSSSGRQHRFQYRLEQAPDGTVSYVNDCGLQLMINNVLRGPDPRRVSSEQALQDELMASIDVCKVGGDSTGCDHTPGKSIFRPDHVLIPDVHAPREMKEGFKQGYNFPARDQGLLCNHFYKRSYEDAYLKAAQWRRWQHLETFNKTDRPYWSAVRDDWVQRTWHHQLSRRMRELATLGAGCPDGLAL